MGLRRLEESVVAPSCWRDQDGAEAEGCGDAGGCVGARMGRRRMLRRRGLTQTIAGDRLQSLADDPDDLMRRAAAAGGGWRAETLRIRRLRWMDFRASSALPPKSSIAYIKVNPDQFSAEYREPPFDGGRVEIYTKPGQKAFHGAVFATNGSPWENARDPFSVSKAPIGQAAVWV